MVDTQWKLQLSDSTEAELSATKMLRSAGKKHEKSDGVDQITAARNYIVKERQANKEKRYVRKGDDATI